MSATHPLFKDMLGHMFGQHSQAITSQADVVLICGTYVFPEVFPALSEVFAPGAKVINIDLNAYEVAKNFPVDLGFISDPKTTLAKLAVALDTTMTSAQKTAATSRAGHHAAIKEQEMAANVQRTGPCVERTAACLSVYGRVGVTAERRAHLR